MAKAKTATAFGAKVDHLKPNMQTERGRGTAKGIFYAGIAATGRQGPDAPAFALMAADLDTLESLWDQFMYPTPLNRKATYPVCMFQRSDVTEDDPNV